MTPVEIPPVLLLTSDDWTAIGAVGTALAIIPASFAIYVQFRQAKLIHAHETLLQMHERWASEEFMQLRAEAARALLDGRDLEADEFEVANFFETMGLLLRRGALDKQLVWSEFAYDILRYHRGYCMNKNQLQLVRDEEGDSNYYCEFEYLHEKVLSFDARRRADRRRVALADSTVRDYLEGEANLVTHGEA